MNDLNLSSHLNTSLLAAVTLSTAKATNINYEWRIILPLYVIIFTLSISGNCLVIATLAGNRQMRTVTNVYLLNLASSDIMLGVFCMPFTLVGQIYKRFLFGPVLCKLIPFLQAVSVSVDVWTLVAISLERYFAICRPLKSRKWQTQFHANKMIAIIWLMSLAFNSPILIVSKLQPMKNNAYKCREDWGSLTLERTFSLSLDAALLVVPFFIMTFAYALIVSKLWRGMRHEIKHNANWQKNLTRHGSCKTDHCIPHTVIQKTKSSEPCCINNCGSKKDTENISDAETKSTQSFNTQIVDLEFKHAIRSTHIDKSIQSKRKVISMLFVIIVEFFVCWTPLHAVNTIYLFYPDELFKYIGAKGVMLLQLLAYCSSCSNPITYCFMNKKFRQEFLSLFRTCRLRGCYAEKSECRQATPQPSSQEITACAVKGSQTGRSDLDGVDREDSDHQRFPENGPAWLRASSEYRPGYVGARNTSSQNRRRRQPVLVSHHLDQSRSQRDLVNSTSL